MTKCVTGPGREWVPRVNLQEWFDRLAANECVSENSARPLPQICLFLPCLALPRPPKPLPGALEPDRGHLRVSLPFSPPTIHLSYEPEESVKTRGLSFPCSRSFCSFSEHIRENLSTSPWPPSSSLHDELMSTCPASSQATRALTLYPSGSWQPQTHQVCINLMVSLLPGIPSLPMRGKATILGLHVQVSSPSKYSRIPK